MADEFVDLYELLGLPLDAERDVLRKRINELYLEAQRNLDHRNFQTRVRYQEMFEVRMPQARYILLDAGRRAEYDRLVSAMRGTPASPSVPPPHSKPSKKNDPKVPSRENPALGTGSTAGFKLAAPETEVAGKAPTIEPLPVSGFDSERGAKERDELWRKWKSGLEEALAREKEVESTHRETPVTPTTSSPTPRTSKPAQTQPSTQSEFSGQSADDEAREQERLLQQQQEQRRTEHRRKIMKDMLEGAGLKGTVIGIFAVLVPGVIAMLAFMSHYYPRGAKPLLQLQQNLAWLIWGVIIAVGAFIVSRMLSKSMRRNMASELNSLSYESLVRRSGRS